MRRLSTENFRAAPALACFLLTAVIGVSVDLWTKQLAYTRLAPQGLLKHPDGTLYNAVDEPYRIIPGWLHFQFTANRGAVFGIGQGQRSLFLAVSIAAIAFIFYLFATSGRQRFYQFVLGMLLAGVVGNMYDRYRLEYVRDMIYIFPGRHIPGLGRPVFPWIFNVADSLLCVGVALIFLYSLFVPQPGKPEPEAADYPPRSPHPEPLGAGLDQASSRPRPT